MWKFTIVQDIHIDSLCISKVLLSLFLANINPFQRSSVCIHLQILWFFWILTEIGFLSNPNSKIIICTKYFGKRGLIATNISICFRLIAEYIPSSRKTQMSDRVFYRFALTNSYGLILLIRQPKHVCMSNMTYFPACFSWNCLIYLKSLQMILLVKIRIIVTPMWKLCLCHMHITYWTHRFKYLTISKHFDATLHMNTD